MRDERKFRESQFHDDVFRHDDSRRSVSKFYAVVKSSWTAYEAVLARACGDKDILEYGCGPGSYAFYMAERGGRVIGIDLSRTAIERARTRASDRSAVAQFCVMDAERLGFKDDTFDVICGRAILHHLDISPSIREITRVLRSGGHAVFLEPLGHNPLINWYRRRTPSVRTVDEHPLMVSDLEQLRDAFRAHRVQYFHFLSLLIVPFRNLPGYGMLLRCFDALDQALFRVFPPARRLAWTVVLEMRGPKACGSGEEKSLGRPIDVP